jgi:hypothetical protein
MCDQGRGTILVRKFGGAAWTGKVDVGVCTVDRDPCHRWERGEQRERWKMNPEERLLRMDDDEREKRQRLS